MLAHLRQWIKSPLVQAMPCHLLCAKPLSQSNMTIGPLWMNNNIIEIQHVLFKKMYLKRHLQKGGHFVLASMYQVSRTWLHESTTGCHSSYASYIYFKEKGAVSQITCDFRRNAIHVVSVTQYISWKTIQTRAIGTPSFRKDSPFTWKQERMAGLADRNGM